MPNQTKIAEAVEASRNEPEFALNPAVSIVDVTGKFGEPVAAVWAEAMRLEDPAGNGTTIVCIDDVGDRLEPDRVERECGEGRLHFQVRMPSFEHSAHVVCREQFKAVLLEPSGKFATIRVAGLVEGFATPSLVIEPWTDITADGPARHGDTHQNARRVVRSLDRSRMAPEDVSRWLATNLPADEGWVVEEFRGRAVDLLLRSIVSELYTEDDVRRCVLASTPSRRLSFGPDVAPDSMEFQALVTACDWIYGQGADVEVRHALFVNELGREWPETVEFRTGIWSRLATTLDATKLVYRAHLQAGSKDTLKSLTDLRKALGEEIQKLMQQTKDLSASLWRDVAVALGVTALRFGVDPARTASASPIFAFVFVACAVYLVGSLALTTKTNAEFLRVVDQTRNSWRTKLYGYLDSGDYEKLADGPLRRAEEVYRNTVRWAWCVVLLVVTLLLAMAASEADFVNWTEVVVTALLKLRLMQP